MYGGCVRFVTFTKHWSIIKEPMPDRRKKSQDQIEEDRQRYGEVVAFRLHRDLDHPDELQVLTILKEMSKDEKKFYIVSAILNQAGVPLQNDNARTAAELRQMVSELTEALQSAHRLIERLTKGGFTTNESNN